MLLEGLVVANDADYRRSHMLVHQSKRLQSACFMATNHKAQQLPTVHVVSDKHVSHIILVTRFAR